jgi:hypothetical protein
VNSKIQANFGAAALAKWPIVGSIVDGSLDLDIAVDKEAGSKARRRDCLRDQYPHRANYRANMTYNELTFMAGHNRRA